MENPEPAGAGGDAESEMARKDKASDDGAKLPKRIAGVKIPKALRKAPGGLGALLDHPVLRAALAEALVAAAAAAAAALTRPREAEAEEEDREPIEAEENREEAAEAGGDGVERILPRAAAEPGAADEAPRREA